MSVAPGPTQPSKPILLIVDDEPDVLETLQHLFRRRYRVLTSGSAPDAVGFLEREPVAVLLCDQRMPGMTGDELLELARQRFPDVVRLLFTGYADLQAVTRAINQGEIFRYILKPWVAEELESTIAQAVAQHELIVERRRLLVELSAANEQLTVANRDLEESNAMKVAFLEVASHELNTPITIIQGLGEVLLRTNPDRTEPERGVVQQIVLASQQLGRLVSTMLKLVHARDYRHAQGWSRWTWLVCCMEWPIW